MIKNWFWRGVPLLCVIVSMVVVFHAIVALPVESPRMCDTGPTGLTVLLLGTVLLGCIVYAAQKLDQWRQRKRERQEI